MLVIESEVQKYSKWGWFEVTKSEIHIKYKFGEGCRREVDIWWAFGGKFVIIDHIFVQAAISLHLLCGD